jgi:membrane-bound serine protease (ClpP class)
MESELVQELWSLLTNPNVVYVLFIVGLWAAAAAFNSPGTGLLEVTALICLALAIAGLTQLPVNVVGVILIVIAGALFVVDLKVQSVAITVGATVSLMLGSLFLFPPIENTPRLSPWLIVGVALLSLFFFGVALSAAIRTRRLRVKVSAETIVGQRGVVATPIDPVGTVQVQSELWTAVADEPIGLGEEVEIAALEGLKVRVRRVSTIQQKEVVK